MLFICLASPPSPRASPPAARSSRAARFPPACAAVPGGSEVSPLFFSLGSR